MTSIDTAPVARYGAHEYDAAPAAALHVWHAELTEQERGAEVGLYSDIPLLDRDIKDVGNTLAIARVTDEYVRSRLAVLLADLIKEAVDVGVLRHVNLVGRDADVDRFAQGGNKLVDGDF